MSPAERQPHLVRLAPYSKREGRPAAIRDAPEILRRPPAPEADPGRISGADFGSGWPAESREGLPDRRSGDEVPGHPLPHGFRRELFPLEADPREAERAELELIAQAPQDGGLVVIERARHVVRL